METPEERLKKEKGRREYCKYKITVEESNKLVIDGFRCNALDIYTLFVWYNVKDIYGNASIIKTYSREDMEKIRKAKKGTKRDTKELGCIPIDKTKYRKFNQKKYDMFNGINPKTGMPNNELSPLLSKDMLDIYAKKEDIFDIFSTKELLHMYCIAHAKEPEFYEILIGKRRGRINSYKCLTEFIDNDENFKGMKRHYLEKILLESRSTIYRYLSDIRNSYLAKSCGKGKLDEESKVKIENSMVDNEIAKENIDYVYICFESVRKKRNTKAKKDEYEIIYKYGEYDKSDKLKRTVIYVDDIGCGVYEKLTTYATARINRVLLVEEYANNIYEEISLAIDYATAWNYKIYKIEKAKNY